MKNNFIKNPHKQDKAGGYMLHKLGVMLLLCYFLLVGKSVFAQQGNYTLSLQNATLTEVMDFVKQKSSYYFLYNDDDIKHIKNININIKQGTIKQLLNQALKGKSLGYSISNKTITLRKIKAQNQQQKTVMFGKVIDKAGNSIPGVSVFVKGTQNGVSTDIEGKYKISSLTRNQIVVFSFIGMQTQEVPLVNGEKNIVLLEKQNVLNDVVVTGYQKMNINEMAGSINKVEMKSFEKRIAGGGSSLMTTLEGLSASLVAASDASSNGSKKLMIRGISTLEGNSNPLIVVDGFPYSGSLESINPYDIESITMLKDAASASIYGAMSGNGVIVITTKRGKSKGVKFEYNNNIQVSEKKDLDYYMNRASSSDMVDLEMDYFENYKDRLYSCQYYFEKGYEGYNTRTRNKTIKYLLENKEGRLSDADLKQKLNALRNIDNLEDYKKLLLQTPVYQEHNFAVEYATKNLKLRSSLNYFKNKSGFKGTKNEGVKYAINTYLDANRLRLDLKANFHVGSSDSYKTRFSDILNFSPYERIWDNEGNPLAVTKPTYGAPINGIIGGKDQFEIDRLVSLGLLDETYYPARDYGLSTNENKNWGAHFQAQMRLELAKGLKATVAFNINKGAAKNQTLTHKNSWEMRSLFNNLTARTKDGKKGEVLIPIGHKLYNSDTESTSYLLRGQLQYNRKFNETHKIDFLFGSEIRSNKFTATMEDRLGYNSKSNIFRSDIDYKTFRDPIKDVFFPNRYHTLFQGLYFRNYFSENENRYFSLYTNATYNYNEKYVLHGSMRIDQSNLFGTDPKYRYKPFWSVGAKWRIKEEDFFQSNLFSRLDLQLSYGINGNISNSTGPYDLARATWTYRANQAPTLIISSPSVPDLRWEKTQTFNIGVHSSILENRIGFSFDYYRKKTKDVFANTEIDPTLGFANIKKNDATIVNNGFEFALNTVNVSTKDFQWSTYLGINYNKSKVEKVFIDKENNPAYWLAGKPINMKGYAPNSIFVFKYAGVDKKGYGLIEQKNENKVSIEPYPFNPKVLLHEDLKYAGQMNPDVVGRLTNNLRYKNFELSFMFVYQGGHVLIKDSFNGEYIGSGIGVVNKDVVYAWKKAGDEEKPNILPRVGGSSYSSIIRNSTKNIIDGDFIRLRDVVLSYELPQSVLQKNNFFKRVVFNLKGQNLYLWTKNKEGIDPEAHGLGYRYFPVVKSVSLGVNLTF